MPAAASPLPSFFLLVLVHNANVTLSLQVPVGYQAISAT
jgi:hypothetical protein